MGKARTVLVVDSDDGGAIDAGSLDVGVVLSSTTWAWAATLGTSVAAATSNAAIRGRRLRRAAGGSPPVPNMSAHNTGRLRRAT